MKCWNCEQPMIEKGDIYHCPDCNIELDYKPGITMADKENVEEENVEEENVRLLEKLEDRGRLEFKFYKFINLLPERFDCTPAQIDFILKECKLSCVKGRVRHAD